MKDIKTLYTLAKSSKGNKEIKEYQEAINELLESNPIDYISNIEYIISSNIGLQTLNEFVDKYGLSVAYYDVLMESINNCIRKCEIYKYDTTLYNETVSFLESFHSKYENCFNMFYYFKDNLPDNYINTYYGFNNNGIQNKKLISGMINKFGEAAIPDILITSRCLGDNAINTTLKFLENNEIFNSPLTYQWIIESCNDLGIEDNVHLANIKSRSAESIVYKMRQRNNDIYREAVIMNNHDMFLEYSEDEISAIRDLISVREYQMLCTESYDKIFSIQNEVYSLYEEFDGIEDKVDPSKMSINIFGNGKHDIPGSDKYNLTSIRDRLNTIIYNLEDIIKTDFREKIKEQNYSLPFFNRKVERPMGSIYIGDNYGPIKKIHEFKESDVFKFININKLDDENEYVDGMKIWVKLYVDTRSSLSYDDNKRSTNLFYDILLESIKSNIKHREINIDPLDKRELGQIRYKRKIEIENPDSPMIFTYEWLIPLCIYKEFITGNRQVTESLSTVNTRNKKTGDIPDYLARNHDLEYGEYNKNDKNVNTDKDDKEKTEDDFIRPSAMPLSTAKSDEVNYDDMVIHGNDISKSGSDNSDKNIDDSKDKGSINNYYYYTYNNSLNKNTHSFNKDSSNHSLHDQSNHTDIKKINDDHSKGKRINSNDTKYYSDSDEEDITEENTELKFPWELDVFTEKKTKLEYRVNAFKKKYKYNPSNSTIEVDGNRYKVDLNINDKTIEVPQPDGSTYHFPRTNSSVPNYEDKSKSTIYLDVNFFSLPSTKSQDALLQHEIGHIQMLTKRKANNEKDKKELEKTRNAAMKYDKSNLNPHANTDEYDADRYAANRVSETSMKRALRHLHKILKNKKNITKDTINELIAECKSQGMSNEEIKEFIKISKDEFNEVVNSSYNDYKNKCKNDNMPIHDIMNKKTFISKNFPGYDQYMNAEFSYLLKTVNKQNLVDYNQRRKALNDKTLRNSSLYKKESPDILDGKPESDHPIKDRLTDIDRELVKKQQNVKKKVQDIQNTGKAFIKPAIRTKELIANTVAKWKDNDETKLKEKLADPLARKNLFSAIKASIAIGSLAKAGLLFNPIFAFLAITKKIGKNKKEYRIRNEMIGELKTEVKIIKEKIKDAHMNGDMKAKYQLMRLENELNKKIARVGGGKGWKDVV